MEKYYNFIYTGCINDLRLENELILSRKEILGIILFSYFNQIDNKNNDYGVQLLPTFLNKFIFFFLN